MHSDRCQELTHSFERGFVFRIQDGGDMLVAKRSVSLRNGGVSSSRRYFVFVRESRVDFYSLRGSGGVYYLEYLEI